MLLKRQIIDCQAEPVEATFRQAQCDIDFQMIKCLIAQRVNLIFLSNT